MLPWGINAAEARAFEAMVVHGGAKPAAERLGRSHRTVETQVHAVYRKMRTAGVLRPEAATCLLLAARAWWHHWNP